MLHAPSYRGFKDQILTEFFHESFVDVGVELCCLVVVSEQHAGETQIRVVALSNFFNRASQSLKALQIVSRGENRNNKPVGCDESRCHLKAQVRWRIYYY